MTTEKPRKRQFTDEFKADAVQLVVQSDRPIAQVARELEINESSLGYWVKNYRQAHPDPTVAPTPVDAANRPDLTLVERASAAVGAMLDPARPVTVAAWESFGNIWIQDAVKQLKLPNLQVLTADYGEIPDLTTIPQRNDVVFTWNGTTSGVRVPNGDAIPADRAGLTICGLKATSLPSHSRCAGRAWSTTSKGCV